MAKHYLLSRPLDPLLGLFTGLLAYHLHETNPRTAPPPGHTLRELAGWHWARNGERRRAREAAEDGAEAGDAGAAGAAEWAQVRREMDEAEGK